MRLFSVLWSFFVSALVVFANNTPSTTSGSFVTAQGNQFQVNGSQFRWIGTTAYWLPALNTEQDIIDTLSNMSAAGITVVKTWAFNDVETIPENGTWFQLVANGTTTVNTGPNGLQKLDMVMKHAERFGIYVVLSLTNNWNPRPLFDDLKTSIDNLTNSVESRSFQRRDITPGTNNSLPRNFLSNDYGGMDIYVRQFGLQNHDEFYQNETLITAFENYTRQVITRYVNSTAVFSWEIANDPRCNSTVPASSGCKTTTVTRWHSRLADHIRSIDPNHLISTGSQGFLCPDCEKLFTPTTPPPQPSPAPGQRRKNVPAPLTKKRIIQERVAQWKKTRRAAAPPEGGIQIRGRWVSTPTRRQADTGVGSAFDGSQGVDSEDIANIPNIGFSTFQLFPDQFSYGPPDPSLPEFNQTVEIGNDWIRSHAEAGARVGKPVALTGFGLVTNDNKPFFVPFNSSVASFPNATSTSQGFGAAPQNTSQAIGVTNDQQVDAYSQWVNTGLVSGLQGIMQYQWGQRGLTSQEGTTISPNDDTTTTSPNEDTTTTSPNDGYSAQAVSSGPSAQGVLQSASQQISNSLSLT
ncbi:glycoside hydrolase family 5 protein [Dendrothele bispora CBS 962.96]|uniref:mannan endo-1,4-beta-mannosidase n=1 Tax=Dendrothele bispora (strain CBS 962.96) TaxID=1314807 RepID=A0A4S8LKR4_DENBC|nr:glycoside hydrolase family 5 protein [Dendrothele bispora CBS 962.96]